MAAISCEKEYEIPEYDTWPVSADIFVVDKDGNNLIDPEFPGNILDENITMVHEGKVYERLDYCEPFAGDPDIPDVETKALPPAKFRGLQTVHHVMNHGYNSKHYLVIGYYEPDENFDWKEFVIDWGGDGSSDVIGLSNSSWIEYNKKERTKYMTHKSRYWLNGEEVTSITIVR